MKWIIPPALGLAVFLVVFTLAINRELSKMERHMVDQLETLTRIVDQINESLQ